MPRTANDDLPVEELDALATAATDWDSLAEEVHSGDEDMLDEEEEALEQALGLEDEDGDDVVEEDDDNAYQDSDEALPDDGEERSISRRLRQD